MHKERPRDEVHIEVINLPHRHDRRAWMERELERHDLSAHARFVNATDAGRWGEEQIAALRHDSPRSRGMSTGAIGCFLSHRQCWQNLLARHGDALVVLEDDVRMGQGARQLLGDLRWVPEEADLVKLDLFPEWTVIGPKSSSPAPLRTLHPLLGRHLSSAAYIVTRRGAERLVGSSDRLPDAVDHYLFNPHCGYRPALNVLQLNPAIAIQVEYLPHAQRPADIRQSDIDPAGLKALPGAITKPHHALTHPFRTLGRHIRATTHGWFRPTRRLRLKFL